MIIRSDTCTCSDIALLRTSGCVSIFVLHATVRGHHLIQSGHLELHESIVEDVGVFVQGGRHDGVA